MDTERDYVELYGSYLDPPHVVGLDLPDLHAEDVGDLWKATLRERGHRIARTFTVGESTVYVTHAGGIFVAIEGLTTGAIPDFFERQHEYVETLNLVICNLNLQEAATCGPVSPRDLGIAVLRGNEAWVGAGTGQLQGQRNLAVVDAIRNAHPLVHSWPQVSSAALERAVSTDHAQRLSDISPSLPELIAAAAVHSYRGRHAEALVTAFVVVEQIIGHLWRQHIVAKARDPSHRDALKTDHRTFSASVKTEILWQKGLLPGATYDAIQAARRARNRFVHEARLDKAAQRKGITAMNATVVHFLQGHPSRHRR